MKLVTAIFKPSRLDAVIDALTEAGATGLTVSEVRGYGRQLGKTEVYRGAEYEVRLLPKVKVEVACTDDSSDRLADAIVQAANTGTIGDGKVFIHDLETVVRVRTGDRDENAVAQ
jgi:nitrogen regulatory protein P-II 2